MMGPKYGNGRPERRRLQVKVGDYENVDRGFCHENWEGYYFCNVVKEEMAGNRLDVGNEGEEENEAKAANLLNREERDVVNGGSDHSGRGEFGWEYKEFGLAYVEF